MSSTPKPSSPRTEYNRLYRKKNKKKLAAYHRAWRKANPDRRAEGLKGRYGMTIDDYNNLLDAQEGRCAICRSKKPRAKKGLFHVDHCHTTGTVRGLLCLPCNTGLGLFKDNVSTLAVAITYLEKHR